MRRAAIVRVHPGALGQTELGRVVGAVVDALGRHQRLGQHHPDAAGERHLIGVVAVPAPATGALEVEPPGAVAADGHLRRRVHDGVDLAEGRREPHVLVRVRHVDEGHLAVDAWDGHRLEPRAQPAPALLDDLVGELLVGLEPVRLQHLLHQLPDHVAAGDAGALVEDPVLGGAHVALALVQPVAQRHVVDARSCGR